MNCILTVELRALDIYFRGLLLMIITPVILLKNKETMSLNIPHNYFLKINICLKYSRSQLIVSFEDWFLDWQIEKGK